MCENVTKKNKKQNTLKVMDSPLGVSVCLDPTTLVSIKPQLDGTLSLASCEYIRTVPAVVKLSSHHTCMYS